MNQLIKRICLQLITLYKLTISPFFKPTCRFLPTCSSYAEEAIKIHGLKTGLLLIMKRVLKCNLFSKQQIDNVPEKNDEI
jgi:putative membrane protein insertion efficiency factor